MSFSHTYTDSNRNSDKYTYRNSDKYTYRNSDKYTYRNSDKYTYRNSDSNLSGGTIVAQATII
jgi:hypothetical protein